MIDSPPENSYATDFHVKSTLGISLTILPIITPFSINSFIQGRNLTGILSAFIVVALVAIASISSRGKYLPALTLATYVPAVIAVLYMALPQQGIVSTLWYYPAILTFFAMLPEKQAWLANLVLLGTALPRAWSVLEFPLVTRFTATILGVSMVTAIFIRVINNQQKKLVGQALTDPLTGLSNRVMLRDTLEHAIEQNQRNGSPMTLLTLDLDRFKSINDTLGHEAGDQVLRGLGELLRKRIRRADHVFRIGGEEFIALLYDADMENGLQVAEELRNVIETAPLLDDRTVTASIGVASLKNGENWMEWLKRGDENLYRAKSEGRNRVAA